MLNYHDALELWVESGAQADIPWQLRQKIHQKFYRWLIANVIHRALVDIQSTKTCQRDKKGAMEFFKSKYCKMFCIDLNLSYNTILKTAQNYFLKQKTKRRFSDNVKT